MSSTLIAQNARIVHRSDILQFTVSFQCVLELQRLPADSECESNFSGLWNGHGFSEGEGDFALGIRGFGCEKEEFAVSICIRGYGEVEEVEAAVVCC
jgi:hypothetical protein